MAFIREYQAVSAMQGDPFFRGLRRRIKKIGRGVVRGGIGRIVGRVAGFVPGVGQALNLARMAGYSAGDFEHEDDLMDWARSYGYDLGDPGGKPPKRKQAAAGPKAKASRKKAVRRERRRGPGRVERGLAAVSRGIGALAPHLPGLASVGASLIGHTPIQDDLAAAASGLPEAGGFTGVGAAAPGALGGRARVARMTKRGTMTFRKRPSMQPTNTRALNRALRRVEGFKHVVSRVYKALPALRPSPRGTRGHKAGCKCAVCR